MLELRFVATLLLLDPLNLRVSALQFDMANKVRQINEESDIIHSILGQYDKNSRPPPLPNSNSPAIPVSVNMTVLDVQFLPLQIVSMELLVQQSWTDSWLAYSRSGSLLYVCLNGDLHQKIWTPHASFQGDRLAEAAVIMDTSAKIRYDGAVLMRQRLRMKMFCVDDLIKYPLYSSKNCSLFWGSSRYGSEDVSCHWTESATLIRENSLDYGNYFAKNVKFINISFSGQTGSHSAAAVSFIFAKKRFNHELLKLYFPTFIGLTVIWLALFLSYRLAVVKLGFIFCNLVVYCILYFFTKVDSPMNYWDVWMYFCISLTVFTLLLTVLQYRGAAVGGRSPTLSQHRPTTPDQRRKRRSRAADYLWTVFEPREIPAMNLFGEEIESERKRLTTGSPAMTETSAGNPDRTHRPNALIIGTVLSVAYPVAVVSFNVAYWFTALQSKQ